MATPCTAEGQNSRAAASRGVAASGPHCRRGTSFHVSQGGVLKNLWTYVKTDTVCLLATNYCRFSHLQNTLTVLRTAARSPSAVNQVFSGPGPRVPGQRSASTAPQVHVLRLGTCDLHRTVTWPSATMGHTCHHRSDNLVPKGKTRAGRSHHTISEIQPGKRCVVLFVCLFLKFLFLLELLARSSGFFVLLSQSPFLFL